MSFLQKINFFQYRKKKKEKKRVENPLSVIGVSPFSNMKRIYTIFAVVLLSHFFFSCPLIRTSYGRYNSFIHFLLKQTLDFFNVLFSKFHITFLQRYFNIFCNSSPIGQRFRYNIQNVFLMFFGIFKGYLSNWFFSPLVLSGRGISFFIDIVGISGSLKLITFLNKTFDFIARRIGKSHIYKQKYGKYQDNQTFQLRNLFFISFFIDLTFFVFLILNNLIDFVILGKRISKKSNSFLFFILLLFFFFYIFVCKLFSIYIYQLFTLNSVYQEYVTILSLVNNIRMFTMVTDTVTDATNILHSNPAILSEITKTIPMKHFFSKEKFDKLSQDEKEKELLNLFFISYNMHRNNHDDGSTQRSLFRVIKDEDNLNIIALNCFCTSLISHTNILNSYLANKNDINSFFDDEIVEDFNIKQKINMDELINISFFSKTSRIYEYCSDKNNFLNNSKVGNAANNFKNFVDFISRNKQIVSIIDSKGISQLKKEKLSILVKVNQILLEKFISHMNKNFNESCEDKKSLLYKRTNQEYLLDKKLCKEVIDDIFHKDIKGADSFTNKLQFLFNQCFSQRLSNNQSEFLRFLFLSPSFLTSENQTDNYLKNKNNILFKEILDKNILESIYDNFFFSTRNISYTKFFPIEYGIKNSTRVLDDCFPGIPKYDSFVEDVRLVFLFHWDKLKIFYSFYRNHNNDHDILEDSIKNATINDNEDEVIKHPLKTIAKLSIIMDVLPYAKKNDLFNKFITNKGIYIDEPYRTDELLFGDFNFIVSDIQRNKSIGYKLLTGLLGVKKPNINPNDNCDERLENMKSIFIRHLTDFFNLEKSIYYKFNINNCKDVRNIFENAKIEQNPETAKNFQVLEKEKCSSFLDEVLYKFSLNFSIKKKLVNYDQKINLRFAKIYDFIFSNEINKLFGLLFFVFVFLYFVEFTLSNIEMFNHKLAVNNVDLFIETSVNETSVKFTSAKISTNLIVAFVRNKVNKSNINKYNLNETQISDNFLQFDSYIVEDLIKVIYLKESSLYHHEENFTGYQDLKNSIQKSSHLFSDFNRDDAILFIRYIGMEKTYFNSSEIMCLKQIQISNDNRSLCHEIHLDQALVTNAIYALAGVQIDNYNHHAIKEKFFAPIRENIRAPGTFFLPFDAKKFTKIIFNSQILSDQISQNLNAFSNREKYILYQEMRKEVLEIYESVKTNISSNTKIFRELVGLDKPETIYINIISKLGLSTTDEDYKISFKEKINKFLSVFWLEFLFLVTHSITIFPIQYGITMFDSKRKINRAPYITKNQEKLLYCDKLDLFNKKVESIVLSFLFRNLIMLLIFLFQINLSPGHLYFCSSFIVLGFYAYKTYRNYLCIFPIN